MQLIIGSIRNKHILLMSVVFCCFPFCWLPLRFLREDVYMLCTGAARLSNHNHNRHLGGGGGGIISTPVPYLLGRVVGALAFLR